MGKKKNKKNKKEEEIENNEELEVIQNENNKLDSFNISTSNQLIDDNEENIIIKNFSLNAYNKILFENADLTINKRTKYGLIAPNGQGKTTLLCHLYEKKLPVAKNLDIFMVNQEEKATDKNVLDVVLESNIIITKLKNKLEILDNLDRELNEDELDKYNKINEELSNFNSDKLKPKAIKILFGLGFNNEMQQKSVNSFSGGFRMRISIAKALFMEPEMLFLDEPSNHLDLNAVLWLEDYLINYKKTIVLISHNQDFLNNICNEIIHIRNKKIDQYKGNLDDFTKMLNQKKKIEEKDYEKYQKKLKELKKNNNSNKKSEEIANKNSKKDKKNKKNNEEISSSDKIVLEKVIKPRDYRVNFSFPEPSNIGNLLIDLQNLTFGYSLDKILFKNLTFGVSVGDRICVIGPNGAGKSTLLNIMCNDLECYSGDVNINRKIKVSRFNQHFVDKIPLDITPVEFLQKIDTNLSEQQARKVLGSFGLESFAHKLLNENLSGGQKARVQFAMISVMKPHIIMLDEPTNHLDIESINALIESINNYKGTIIMITHDTKLIDETNCVLYICQNQKLEKFDGDLEDYKDTIINYNYEEEIEEKKEVSIFDLL
jgi:ATP-binding cassette subfamily F protein 1